MAVEKFGEILTRLIGTNLVFGIEDLFLISTILGCIIFMAKDFKLGIAMLFILLASEFILFNMVGMATFHVFMAFMISLVIMALSLYTSYAKRNVGIV